MNEKLNQALEQVKRLGQDEAIKQIKENWRLILVAAIVIAISLNSFWSDKSANSKSQSAAPGQNEQSQDNAQGQNNPTPAPQTDNNAQVKTDASSDNAVNEDAIAKTAKAGEGVTHLARQAIKEYLESTDGKLSNEQKIYAEDYLKRQVGSKRLEVGQTVKFDKNMLKTGVEKAEKLSEKQIKNLSKFVPLAKNL